MKFTVSHGIYSVEFEFLSSNPSQEIIAQEILYAIKRMNILIEKESIDLRMALPLAHGLAIAQYIEGMRELVCYDINTDGYLVRHDWLDSQGRKVSCPGEKISYVERTDGSFEEAVLLRRKAAMKVREAAK